MSAALYYSSPKLKMSNSGSNFIENIDDRTSIFLI